MKSSSQHICLDFSTEKNDFKPIIKELLDCAISTFEPSDKFGCCDKYIECSNAKKCLHNNLFYAKACYYRKNLESGKIFYGDNKNIWFDKSAQIINLIFVQYFCDIVIDKCVYNAYNINRRWVHEA